MTCIILTIPAMLERIGGPGSLSSTIDSEDTDVSHRPTYSTIAVGESPATSHDLWRNGGSDVWVFKETERMSNPRGAAGNRGLVSPSFVGTYMLRGKPTRVGGATPEGIPLIVIPAALHPLPRSSFGASATTFEHALVRRLSLSTVRPVIGPPGSSG